MKRASKVKEALKVRMANWDNMPTNYMIGPHSKKVHDPHMKATYHRPGSQNSRKGSSGRKSRR